MKILWIGGNHPRHLYFVNRVREAFDICGVIVELRENPVPQPPQGLQIHDHDNFVRHFEDRDKAESAYFGDQVLPDCPRWEVDEKGLNTNESVDFIKSCEPDLVLIFGSGLIKEPLYSALPRHSINLHLGLSPRYRGAATLFWPFYFLEPTYSGSTFHYIVAEPDAGNVIHQVVPSLNPHDGIHDVGCRTVRSSAEEAIDLLTIFQQKQSWDTHQQRGTGKNFLERDFRPEHLRVVYNLFDNDMVDMYLDGRLKCRQPKLFRQF